MTAPDTTDPTTYYADSCVGRRYRSDMGHCYEVLSSDGCWVVVREVDDGNYTDRTFIWHASSLLTMHATD